MKQELIEKTISRDYNRHTFIYNRYIQKVFQEQGICLEDKIDNLGDYFSDTSIYLMLLLNNGLECKIYFKEINKIHNIKILIYNSELDGYSYNFGDLLSYYSVRKNKFINYNHVSENKSKDIENLIKVLTYKIDLKEKLENKLPEKQIKVGVKKI